MQPFRDDSSVDRREIRDGAQKKITRCYSNKYLLRKRVLCIYLLAMPENLKPALTALTACSQCLFFDFIGRASPSQSIGALESTVI